MKDIITSVKKSMFFVIFILFLFVFCIGQTFAEHNEISNRNEFIGIAKRNETPDSGGQPDNPNVTQDNTKTSGDNSQLPGDSSMSSITVPSVNTNSSANSSDPGTGNPVMDNPDTPLARLESPALPSEVLDATTNQPKTADPNDPISWLTAMAVCAYLLRYTLFTHRRKE